jgi:hypothetical protein
MDYPDAITQRSFTTRESHLPLFQDLRRVCGVSLVATFVLLGTTASHGASSCNYTVSVPSLGMTAVGGNLTISIQTGRGCAWSIFGLPAWLTVSGSTEGIGSAEVTVVASDNPGPTRIGVFTVAGVSVPVRQFDSSACPEGTACLIRPLPHIAFGGVWTTEIFAVSWAKRERGLSIAFYDDNGSPVAAPLTGGFGKVNTLTDSVPALGRRDYEARDAGAPIQSGWALVTADSSVETQAVFRNAAPSGTYYEAAVQTGEAYSHFLIPFDMTTVAVTGRPLYTAFAIVNLNPLVAANVVCSARDGSGTVIPNALTIPSLKPLGHYAGYLSGPFTGMRGTLDCNADTLVSAIAFRLIGDEAFSTLPVIVPDP